MTARRLSPATAGFTLLEVLVVLVLTGLASTILLQGLQHVFRLQGDFGAEIYRTRQGAMQAAWFRQSVNALMPDYAEGRHKFRGQRDGFDGLTLSPLDLADGTLAPFSWRLRFERGEGRTVLHYGQGTDPIAVLSLRGRANFEYLDATGTAHESWPPFTGTWPQLPSAIRLQGVDEPSSSLLVVPKGPITPTPRVSDFQDK
jgi:prepilin-type N-terminal cleavage/methylation domain-containing protein